MATLQRTGITGSLNISGSGASGSIVLNITGSTGTLFIVDDVNSGSLFNVNNAVGLPVLEAFSDGTVNIGKYGSEGVKVYSNGNVSIANGALIVSSSGYVPTFPVGTNITSTDSVNRLYFTSNSDTTISSNGQFHINSNGYQVAQFSNNANGYFINTMYLGKGAGLGVNYARHSNFFGNYAGNGNYWANYVNAQGYSAGQCGSNSSNYHIDNSNFFGYKAGASAVSYYNDAYSSNFFGNQAGYAGNHNYARNSNFFGNYAGSTTVTNNASNSNFFGYQAGYMGGSTNNASLSNFFGNSAGFGASGASKSNFQGYKAGYNATNANNSTFIGYQAGLNDTVNNSSGPKSSILIGDYTSTAGNSDSIAIGKGTANSTNNQFNIGNVLFGLNIYSGSTPTSTAQTNGRVGIGKNNPVNTLDVVGNISSSVITSSTHYYTPALSFISSSTTTLYITSSGNVGIGNTTFNSVAPEKLLVSGSTFNVISGYGNINNYIQLNIKNNNSGATGSSDIVATNDTGTEIGNYVDLGINSSGHVPNGDVGQANDGYLYNTGSNFYIGNATPGRALLFFAGSATSTASVVLSSSGNFGIGITSPVNKLDVGGNISASAITASIIATGASLSILGASATLTIPASGSAILISQSLVQTATSASQIYGVNLNQTFTNAAPNQTQTALRVAPIFTGSFSGSNTRNLIADFSTPSAGTQFSVNDITSGSIYQVNDVSGLPIIEALSDWTVKLWNFPNVVLTKTGSKIGIGTTNPLGTLDVVSTSNSFSQSILVVPPQNNNSAAIYVSGSNTKGGASYIDFLQVTNTSASITNPNKYFRLSGAGDLEILRSNYGLTILSLTNAGVLSTPGGGTSDARVKNNIEYIYDNALPTINQLKPAKFEFNSNLGVARHGFIAQDVLLVKPELVLGDGADPSGTYGLDYDGILALTVKALQEANTKIEQLEVRITQLENK